MTTALTFAVFSRDSIVDIRTSATELSPYPGVFPSCFAQIRDFFSPLCDEWVTASLSSIFPRPNEISPQSPNMAVV
jgi:hypothetical protein